MQADDLDHIRADVQQAVLEAQRHDPTVTLEILWRLFDAVGEVAAPDDVANPSPCLWWAVSLLRDVQLRAVSKVPYGEAPEIEPHEPWEPR